MVCDLILNMQTFQTPPELMQYLLAHLRPRLAARQEVMHSTILPAVRDFQAFVLPLGRELTNAFMNRGGQEAPHAFSYKLGKDLSHSDQRWLQGVGVMRSAAYCCVKTYMKDLSLQQAPVEVIPAGRKVEGRVPKQIVPRTALSTDEAMHFTKLIAKCKTYGLNEAAEALHNFIHECHGTLPRLQWLEAGGKTQCPQLDPAGGNPFFQHLPATSFKLVAANRPASKANRHRSQTAVA